MISQKIEHFIALIPLAIEHGWRLGLLLVVFFGVALWGASEGLFSIPGTIAVWAGPGIAVSLALMSVSVANIVVDKWKGKYDAIQLRRKNAQNARKNLELLTNGDKRMLYELLASNKSRFHIGRYHANYTLLQKGILIEVKQLQGSLICDLHPGILSIRKELLCELADMQKD